MKDSKLDSNLNLEDILSEYNQNPTDQTSDSAPDQEREALPEDETIPAENEPEKLADNKLDLSSLGNNVNSDGTILFSSVRNSSDMEKKTSEGQETDSKPQKAREKKTGTFRKKRVRTESASSMKLPKVLSAVCAALLLCFIAVNIMPGAGEENAPRKKADLLNLVESFSDHFQENVTEAVTGSQSTQTDDVLLETELAAPKPNQTNYGTLPIAAATYVRQLEEKAEESGLLQGQHFVFSSDVSFYPDSYLQYYEDDTILMVCWKENIQGHEVTCCEVKIADASQLRRKLAQNSYGSSVELFCSELSEQCNAVVAVNGDLYRENQTGISILNRQLVRFGEFAYGSGFSAYNAIDSLLVDANGDFYFFSRRDQISREELEQRISDQNILFSLAYGPILVQNGELSQAEKYPLGNVEAECSRAGIAQIDTLHYLYLTVDSTDSPGCTIAQFAQMFLDKGARNAYCLAGGQAAEICVNGEPFNTPDCGNERRVSDIVYFATAVRNEVGE